MMEMQKYTYRFVKKRISLVSILGNALKMNVHGFHQGICLNLQL